MVCIMSVCMQIHAYMYIYIYIYIYASAIHVCKYFMYLCMHSFCAWVCAWYVRNRGIYTCVLLYVCSMHDIYACMRSIYACIYACMGCVVYMYACMLGMHLCMYAYMRFVYAYVHGISGLYVFVRVTYIIYSRVVCMYVCMYVSMVFKYVWYGMVCVSMCGVYVCKIGIYICFACMRFVYVYVHGYVCVLCI